MIKPKVNDRLYSEIFSLNIEIISLLGEAYCVFMIQSYLIQKKKSNFLGLHQNLYISHKLINEMSEDGSIFPHKRQKLGASKYILQKKEGGKIS